MSSSLKVPALTRFHTKKNEKPGMLVPIEDYDIGMDIKRIFYIFGFNTVEAQQTACSRGNHGHYNATQVLICVHGSCQVQITNSKMYDETYQMTQPDMGIVLPPGYAIEMSNFSPDAVLLVLCDQNYRDDSIFSK